MSTQIDCATCGGCCLAFNDGPVFCDLLDGDIEKLDPADRIWVCHGDDGKSKALQTKTLWHIRGPLAGLKSSACIFLVGHVLEGAHCAIHEQRPTVCRIALQPGDEACLGRRKFLLDASAGRQRKE